MALLLFDEVLGNAAPVGVVRRVAPRMTVRELIRHRVELEVERQQQMADVRATLPSAAERTLNPHGATGGFGAMFAPPGKDLEALVAAAEEGFARARFVLLLDDAQAENLDEEIDIGTTARATFLILTPLQGG